MKSKILFLKKNEINNVAHEIIKSLVSSNFTVVVSETCRDFENNINDYDILIDCMYGFTDYNYVNFKNLIINNKLKKILLAFDDEYKFNETLFLAQYYDLVLTTDYITSLRLQQLGINAKHFMFPVICRDNYSYPPSWDYSIGFIGRIDSSKPARKYILDSISKKFGNVNIIDTSKVRLSQDEIHQMYFKTKINLNFTGVSKFISVPGDDLFPSLKTGMKARPFEIGGQCGFCLSEFSESLNQLNTNNGIYFFKTVDECISQILLHLDDDQARNSASERLFNLTKNSYSVNSNSNNFIKLIELELTSGYLNSKVDLNYISLRHEKERVSQLIINKCYKDVFLSLIFLYYHVFSSICNIIFFWFFTPILKIVTKVKLR